MLMRPAFYFSAAAILLTAFASLSRSDELQTSGGKTLPGELVSVDAKAVVMRGSAGNVRTPTGEILQVHLQRETAIPADIKYTDIELTDGSLLHCVSFSLREKQVEA